MNKPLLCLCFGLFAVSALSSERPRPHQPRLKARSGEEFKERQRNERRKGPNRGPRNGEGVRRAIPNFKISSKALQPSFHGETRLVIYDKDKNLELLVTKKSNPRCLDATQNSGTILQASLESRIIDLGGVVYRPYQGKYFAEHGRRYIEVDVQHCVIQ